ncbi:MAG: carboxypeptidase regulatory-like domain-containing protein [Polyangia bacterium]|nr:carboxypeptidase regulatory-like domain-containing protein [Polyangia bacterium]
MNRSTHWIIALLLLAVLGVGSLLVLVVTRRGPRGASDEGALEEPEVSSRPASREARAQAREVRERIKELKWAVEAPRFLTGTVRSAKGPAVAGAQVRVVLEDGKHRTVRTGSEGDYTLANVPGRAALMEVSAPGYSTRIFEPLVLPASERVRWDVTLDPVEGVHGLVLVGEEPVPGAMVFLTGPGTRSPPARTDSGGRFAIAWPSGARSLQVEAEHGAHGKAQQTVFGPAEVRLVLPGGGYVTGRVEDDRGSPVTSFRLSSTSLAAQRGRPGGAPARSFEHPRGEFRLGPLAPGRQELFAFAEGFQPATGKPVVVEAGRDSSGIVLVLKASGEIYGRITDAHSGAPIPGAKIAPQDWGGPRLAGGALAVADARGDYVLRSLPGSRTSLNVSAAGYHPLLAGGAEAAAGMRIRRDFTLTALAEGERPRGQLTGIGAVMQTTPRGVEIRSLVSGGPAQTALRVGDVVVMVGDEDVRSAGLARVAQAIRGEEGTEVVLWVERGQGPPQRVVLRRALVSFPSTGR